MKLAFAPLFLGCFIFLSGCQYFTDSFESAAALDQSGKFSEAIQAYQNYLKHHSSSPLAPRIFHRIAKNYELGSDYTNAINWYEKVLNEFPGTDEEIAALLDIAALYNDKLKNSAKALEYRQKAFSRYAGNLPIRDAVQSLIEAQCQTATAFLIEKKFKMAVDTMDGIYKTYPAAFISPESRAKVDSLSDRARRAEAIARASVDLITLRSEVPYNKSFEADFLPDSEGKNIPSPDGVYMASRTKASNGVYYLFVAKVPTKDDKLVFKPLAQTFGADKPSWSPDGQELVYWRTKGSQRRLEKTNIKTLATQTLFYTKSANLGIHAAYHPAGNKIAYVYEGKVGLTNTGAEQFKTLLKTNQKLDYTAELTWSTDGTMIRCRQDGKKGKNVDELLILDVSISNNP